MFDRTHVLANECWVATLLPRLYPSGNFSGGKMFGRRQSALNVLSCSLTPDQPFEQRSAGQSIGAMHPRTGNFTDGVQVLTVRLPPLIDPDATAEIVRSRNNWRWFTGNIHPKF